MTRPAAAVPWWVLPAIVASALGSALLTRWLTAEVPAAGASTLQGAAAAAPLPALAASAHPAHPAPVGQQLDVGFQGLFIIDALPALALVSVNGAPATLVKAGDALSAHARVQRIEHRRLIVSDAAGERAVPLGGAVAVLAGPNAPAAPVPTSAQVPAPAVGAVSLQPDDGRAGTGNAAFRAAVASAAARAPR